MDRESPQTALKQKHHRDFLDDAPVVLASVQDAFAKVISALPEDIAHANELSKTLGVSSKLAWQIRRLVYETDPFAAVQYIPGQSSIKKFLHAAATLSVQSDVIASAEKAIQEFERLVRTHADNREAFDILAAGCASRMVERKHLDYRKASFVGNSFSWGVHARIQLVTEFVFPSPSGRDISMVSVCGFGELRRLRPSLSWPIQTRRMVDKGGHVHPTLKREPLEPQGGTDCVSEVPLFPSFCTQPTPEVRRVFSPDGSIRDEVVAGSVGKTGTMDCLIGEIVHDSGPRYVCGDSKEWGVGVHVRTPCEALILDQFIHRDLFGPVTPKLSVFNDLLAANVALPPTMRVADQMPVFETVQSLGRGLRNVRVPEFPRYVEMVDFVLKRMDWKAEQFDGYRVRIEYPPVPMSVVMHNDVPPAPGAGGS
jgi:hypothetical protein